MTTSPTKLYDLIREEKWPEVIERIASHLEELRSWGGNCYLPIHYACWRPSVPEKVIEALIEAYPESLKEKTKLYGALPLHCAASRPSSAHNFDVIKLLLRSYKEGVAVEDKDEQTPLHRYLRPMTSPTLETTTLLVDAYPDAVRMCDKFEMYPLHCAASYGNWEVLEYLINLYPDVLLKKDHEGKTPKDISYYSDKHYMCNKLCVEEEKYFGSNIGSTTTTSVSGEDNSIYFTSNASMEEM